MDIKDLNKSQIILLTLLVSFVVSIATGVTTVSLMQQNPDPVPQTINRIIQRTIETVNTNEPVVPVKKEETKETPLTDGKFMVNIYGIPKFIEVNGVTVANENNEYRIIDQGVLISDRGMVLVDGNLIDEKGTYFAELEGTYFSTEYVTKFKNGFSVLSFKDQVAALPKPPTEENQDIDNTQ